MTNASPTAGLTLEMAGTVARVGIDLPHPKNAFRADDAHRLSGLLDDALAAGARCVVLVGKPSVFCAGWDLASMRPTDDPVRMIEEVVAPLCLKLRALPVPTLSAVAGPALGFGFGLALCCDLCFVAEDARLGSPFAAIGMVPDTGTHYFLRERLGPALAAELVFTGRLLSGTEAAALRLVNGALAPDALVAHVDALAARIAAGPTLAFRLSKEILREPAGLDAVMAHEARQLRAAFASADLQEGLAAFQQRRAPVFLGR